MTQSAYASLAARSTGFQSGIAQAVQLNKVWRQSSIMASMIGQFITDETGRNVVDDGTIPTIEANFIAAIQAVTRKKVVGNHLNFYVSATGNNANDGLSPATAVRTIQQAATLSYWGYDFNNYNAIINIGPGTYTDPVFVQGMPLGCGQLIFQGNPSNPASVVVNVPNGIAFSISLGVFCTISGMTISASGSSNLFVSQGYGIAANQAWVNVDHIVMGSCQTSQWNSWNAGVITANGAPVTFSGSSGIGAGTNLGSQIWLVNSTVTFAPGTSYTTGWAYAQGGATISLNNTSYTGSFTGTRFLASICGIIGVAGAGINVIPGTLPGITHPLGWYG